MKNHSFKQIVFNEKTFPVLLSVFNTERNNNLLFPPHWSECEEIIHIISGHMEIVIDEKKYSLCKNDTIYIGNGVLHTTRYCGNLEFKVLHFDYSIFNISNFQNLILKSDSSEITSSLLKSYILQSDFDKYDINKDLINISEELFKKEISYELAVSGIISKIVVDFIRNGQKLFNFKEKPSENVSRVDKILEIIEKEYYKKLEPEQFAKMLNLQTDYFLKAFKKITSKNLKEYIAHVRIRKAEELILTSDKKIADIAYEVGFDSQTTFNRLYNAIKHKSPSSLKKI